VENYVSITHKKALYARQCQMLFLDECCNNFLFWRFIVPKLWNESYITLLHKKGNKSDPANYREISLTSNLGNLFNKVLYARILKFLNLNKVF
jgi:hypothetical protein